VLSSDLAVAVRASCPVTFIPIDRTSSATLCVRFGEEECCGELKNEKSAPPFLSARVRIKDINFAEHADKYSMHVH
jgi:hypothetical protein